MATGHLHLVLAVLILVGPVLVINADLREQDFEEHGGNIQTRGASIMPRGKKCKGLGGICINENRACPSNKPNGIYPSGPPYCYRNRNRCCTDIPALISPWSGENSCMFGGTAFAPNSYLVEACMELQCINGIWNYTGNFNPACGNCTFGGEPIVYTFDPISPPVPFISNDKTYWTGLDVTGEFVMAQPNFAIPAEFYVNSHFAYDNANCTDYGCIEGVTYHELNITFKMTLPPASDLLGEIKVLVNNNPVTIGNTVEYFYGISGAILVFKHKHILNVENVNCISIVGTKGFSVALCERKKVDWGTGFPWAYISAMPKLLSTTNTSLLYGLCNTWTGDIQDGFWEQNKIYVEDWVCDTWPCFPWNEPPLHLQIEPYLLNSWKFSD